MRTKRKDNFVIIVSIAWILANLGTFFVAGEEYMVISSAIFIVLLAAIMSCRPLMRWFNEK